MDDQARDAATDEILEIVRTILGLTPNGCGSGEFYGRFMSMRALYLKAASLIETLEDMGEYPAPSYYRLMQSCEKLLMTLQPIAAFCDSLGRTKH